MILGVGSDVVQIGRIEALMGTHEARFVAKYFTDSERDLAESRRDAGGHICAYAKRFAAKEAVVKALGSGFTNGIFLKDIGVVHDTQGAPVVELSGGARARLNSITPQGCKAVIHLSLSDDPPVALAFVIIEARKL